MNMVCDLFNMINQIWGMSTDVFWGYGVTDVTDDDD